MTWVPLGSSLVLILAGLLSGMNGSIFPDLCPGNFPKILIVPSRQCLDLVSGLNKMRDLRGSGFSFLFSLHGVCHKVCLCGVSLYGFHLSLIRPSNSVAFSLQFFTPRALRTQSSAISSPFPVEVCIRSLTVLASWFCCIHFMTLELCCRCLLLANG